VLHRGINQEQQGRASERALVLLLLADALKEGEDGEDFSVQLSARHVETHEGFFRVHALMELQHLLKVILVDDDILLFFLDADVGWHAKTGLQIDHLAVDTTQEGAHHSVLVLRSSHVVVQNIGHDRRVD